MSGVSPGLKAFQHLVLRRQTARDWPQVGHLQLQVGIAAIVYGGGQSQVGDRDRAGQGHQAGKFLQQHRQHSLAGEAETSGAVALRQGDRFPTPPPGLGHDHECPSLHTTVDRWPR
jgi:hypothetical protein